MTFLARIKDLITVFATDVKALYALGATVFRGTSSSAATSVTLTPAHQGQILVLSNPGQVVINVQATLPENFYCRIVSTTSGGFRASAGTGVSIGSPVVGYLAVRSPNADADLYAIASNTFILKSGYLAPAFTLNGIPANPLIAVSSSRRITQQYTGNLLRVRRSSDNTLLGIGTTGDALDTGMLASFVGSGSGWVDTLYDQSGNGRHLTQSNTSKQPRIVNSGTLDQMGGRAAVRAIANGATGTYLDTPLAHSGPLLTAIMVSSMNANTNNYGRLLSLGNSGQADYNDGRYAALMSRQDANSAVRTERNDPYNSLPVSYGTAFSYVVSWNGSQASVWLNGVKQFTRDVNVNFDTTTLRVFTSMQLGTENWDGNLCEFIVYPIAITEQQINTIYTDQKAYFSLP